MERVEVRGVRRVGGLLLEIAVVSTDGVGVRVGIVVRDVAVDSAPALESGEALSLLL